MQALWSAGNIMYVYGKKVDIAMALTELIDQVYSLIQIFIIKTIRSWGKFNSCAAKPMFYQSSSIQC